MMNFRNALVLSILISLFAVPSAIAGVAFSLLGAGVLPASFDAAGTTESGKFGFGGGALIEAKFSPMVGLEVGGIYLPRKWSVLVGGVDSGVTATHNSVYVPAGLRIHAGHVLSIEAGGFYDFATDSGADSNYGVQGGLRLSAPLGGSAAIFAEGRYDLGLKDVTIVTGSSAVKINDTVLVLVGLTFGGGMSSR